MGRRFGKVVDGDVTAGSGAALAEVTVPAVVKTGGRRGAAGRRKDGRQVQLTERDELIVRWIVRHGLVSAEQVCREFFGTIEAARRRIRALEAVGLLRRDPSWRGMPLIIRATERGIRLADVDLWRATLDYARVRHALAVVDLAQELTTEHEGSSWVTERELRRDRVRAAKADPSLRQGRTPDGVLVLGDGRRIAVELDLTAKRAAKLDTLVGAYAVDRQLAGVWWYLPSESSAARMRQLVSDRGLEQLLEIRVRKVDRT